jgi:ribosomal 50S subunit-recycling heat shock protein
VRLDKFLKVTGVIRRRTVAQDVIDASHVLLNGRLAKPASTVRAGDALCIDFGRKVVTYEVLDVPDRPVQRVDPETFVRLVSEEIREGW